MKNLIKNKNNLSLEELWKTFKDEIIKSAKMVCGNIKVNKNKKENAW